MSNHGQDYELIPLQRWVTKAEPGPDAPAGSIRFVLHDPISGEPLSPAHPPAFLLDKPALSDGYHALTTGLPDTVIDILCATGEERAEDLGDERFEGSLTGIQVVGHTVDGVLRSGEELLTLSGAGLPYLNRIDRAAESQGITVFPAGLEATYNRATLELEPAGEVERALQAIGDMAATHAMEADASDLSTALLQTIARDLKQWYRALRTGERLQHHAADMAGVGMALEGALLLTPVADGAYKNKFIALGREDTEQKAVDPDSYDEDMQWETAVMLQGFVEIDPR